MNYPEQELTGNIIAAALEVHRFWGPGLNETICEQSLLRELSLRKIRVERQLAIPLIYKGEAIADQLFMDMWVERRVMVENKHVVEILPVHMDQLMTYMRLTGTKVGLLINFRVSRLKEGIRRVAL